MNSINSSIKGYSLLREIHRSTSSVIYYAKNQLGAEVAIKVMIGNADMDLQNLRRHFLRQAQLLVALKHDHITQVYDFYEDSDCVAIIMEYLEGENLQSYITRNPVTSIFQAVEWYSHVLPAFEKAHQMGIIHRDVNPASLFLTKSGKLKILNFGTAKILQDALAENLVGGLKTIIQPELPYYQSPEQILRPSSVDRHSDIYSLGLLFYVITTGVEPYDRKELHNDIIYKPLSKPASYSQDLFDVVTKATAKQVKDRFESSSELLIALEEAVSGVGRKAETDSPRQPYGFSVGKTQFIKPTDAEKAGHSSPRHSTTEIFTETTNNEASQNHESGSQRQAAGNSQSTGNESIKNGGDFRREGNSPPPPPKVPTGEGPPPFSGVKNEDFELRVGNEIYSEIQLRTAAILGGPAVFAYFLSENCKIFREYEKSSKYMMNGILALIPYYMLSALSESAPWLVFLVYVFSWAYMFKLATGQQPHAVEFIRRGGRYRPLGNVVLVYIANIVVITALALKFGL